MTVPFPKTSASSLKFTSSLSVKFTSHLASTGLSVYPCTPVSPIIASLSKAGTPEIPIPLAIAPVLFRRGFPFNNTSTLPVIFGIISFLYKINSNLVANTLN